MCVAQKNKMGAVVVGTDASQQVQIHLNWDFSVWGLHVLPVFAWVSPALQFPPTGQGHAVSEVRLIGDSKLPVGVGGSMNGCLCLC